MSKHGSGRRTFLRETVSGCATLEPPGHPLGVPTAVSIPIPSSPSAARRRPASPSPCASTRASATAPTPSPSRTERPYLTGRRTPPRYGDRMHSLPERALRHTCAAHRPEGETHSPLSTGLLRQLQQSRLHNRTGRRHPGPVGRPSPPCRNRERHPLSQVRRGAQPPALGTLTRQHRLAVGPGDGLQPGPLDDTSVSASRSSPPRPSDDASFPCPDASTARPAASPAPSPRLALAQNQFSSAL